VGRQSLGAIAGLASAVMLAACGTPSSCAPVNSGDLFYTRYSGEPNLKKVHYSYDKGKFVLGKPAAIASLNGVDGVAFAPDGDLLVGSQSDVVHKVKVSGGKATDIKTGGQAAFHISVDPGGKRAWVSGIPGSVAEVPLSPVAPGKTHPVKGDDSAVTTIAFDGSGNAYYTASGAGGVGSFGKIDLKTFTTKRALNDRPGLHGMAFDPFTGNLITFGADRVLQIDPRTEKVASELTVTGGVTLDQGTVNGSGYIYVASNNGQLVFIDYSKSKKVGDKKNFVSVIALEANLDDVAPASGIGSKPCS
jgi:hypothetical protein